MELPSSSRHVETLILGAGPTGLGAATRLHQHKKSSWLMLDAAAEAGGLACTDTTPEGFLFDMGGHVIFSHFIFFDELIETALGGKGEDVWATHERVSYVYLKKTYVPYPFQNNITALPLNDQIDCLNGLIEANKASNANAPPKTFDEWILRVMGEGIANLFMRPYNYKVWAVPTTMMQCGWLGERVAVVSAAKVLENVLRKKTETSWGPNAVFRFPQKGGTGGIWKAVAKLLPAENQRYNAEVVSIDADEKKVQLADGGIVTYDKLLTTLPLDLTLTWLHRKDLADRLIYSSSHIVGLGIRGINPHELKCWLYYPEDDCPFYRCTVFSHYAAANCPSTSVKLPTLRLCGDHMNSDEAQKTASKEPKDGPYWSLMFEISENKLHKKLPDCSMEGVIQSTIQGALNTGLVSAEDEVVSIYHRRLEHGYPTPSLERDAILQEALPFLKAKDIWSRGRFGSYKYEVANQDHSLMLGVEAVDNMLFGTKEFTLMHPSLTNEGGAKNMDLKYITK